MRTEALHDMKGEGFTPNRVRLSLEAEVASADGKLTPVVEELSSTAPIDLHFLQTRQGTIELLRFRATASMAHYEVERRYTRWTFAERSRQGTSRCDLGAHFRPGNPLYLGSAATRARGLRRGDSRKCLDNLPGVAGVVAAYR